MPQRDPETANRVAMSPHGNVATEAARQLQICNACRYCEGYCAVFPAMTRRLEFAEADIHYLANLCHNCGACLHACQYAPPHEFGVNIPEIMARSRSGSYAEFVCPKVFRPFFERPATAMAIVACLCIGIAFWLASTAANAHTFYDIFPHERLLWMFAPVFLFSVLALFGATIRFWQSIEPVTSGQPLAVDSAQEGLANALTLKYLDGGHGEGCAEADDASTLLRRRMHHLTFYGFLLCFAATCVGTVYHYGFNLRAPYDFIALPKLLGISGGVFMLIGSLGLLLLNVMRSPQHGAPEQKAGDRSFILLLALLAASGLALLLPKTMVPMSLMLPLHLGLVLAFFLLMPFSRFVHGFFRLAALLRYAVERRQKNTLKLSDD